MWQEAPTFDVSYCAPVLLFSDACVVSSSITFVGCYWDLFFICLFFSFISFLHAWRLAEGKLFCLCYVGNLKKYSEIRPPIPRTAVVLQWHCALPKEILLHWPVPFSLPTLQTAYKKKKKKNARRKEHSKLDNRDATSQRFFFSLCLYRPCCLIVLLSQPT